MCVRMADRKKVFTKLKGKKQIVFSWDELKFLKGHLQVQNEIHDRFSKTERLSELGNRGGKSIFNVFH
jgi:hypothetical protein